MKINRLYNCDCRIGLKQMIKEQFQVDSAITSPPYWNQRDYGIKPSIWDGDPNCKHQWDSYIRPKNTWGKPNTNEKIRIKGKDNFQFIKERELHFCSKCGAWLGPLGLEPTPELYVKHLCDIYDLVWQVLKLTGTNWVNLGDSYSSGGRSGTKEYFEKGHKQFGRNDPKGRYQAPKKVDGFSSKCLLMIPERFVIEMINRGWVLRNKIVWYKPNSMPESCKDRFTVNFEYIFFFVKNVKPVYWVNNKTAKLVSKKPLGTKGIENEDWRWVECKKCLGTGITHHKCKFCKGEGYYYDKFLRPKICPKCKGAKRIREKSKCYKCKGLGKVKKSYWNSRGYFFEQQFEKAQAEIIFSRNSPKGGIQEKNNPRMRWGYTREDWRKMGYKVKGDKVSGWDRWSKQHDYGIGSKKWKNSKEYGQNKEYIEPYPLGRNKRCVWEIPTKPNPEFHFAVFPDTLVKIPIKAGCPKFVCKECGKPREKIYDKKKFPTRPGLTTKYEDIDIKWSSGSNESMRKRILTKFILNAYSDCGCNVGFKSGIVLDPFAGIGTTLLTAWKLGRDFIGFEISKKYCEIAYKKLSEKCSFKRLDDFIYYESKEIEV